MATASDTPNPSDPHPFASLAETDPHTEWERAAREVWTRELPEQPFDPKAADDANNARVDEWHKLVCQIADTPARTPAGIAAQIRLAIFSEEDRSTLLEADVRGLKNAVAALERLAGEG